MDALLIFWKCFDILVEIEGFRDMYIIYIPMNWDEEDVHI